MLIDDVFQFNKIRPYWTSSHIKTEIATSLLFNAEDVETSSTHCSQPIISEIEILGQQKYVEFLMITLDLQ